ncbi:MAG: Ig-like domain repeat protein [Candidatus Margulisbacteria bacterium]|nr:Ig-like domain repeat protein [Candidatus Margulisiibacteriota bacterium]MBU1955989.1 Ig-like domain repeat protein [Candidatus Margulisiibacteriota bacterium]
MIKHIKNILLAFLTVLVIVGYFAVPTYAVNWSESYYDVKPSVDEPRYPKVLVGADGYVNIIYVVDFTIYHRRAAVQDIINANPWYHYNWDEYEVDSHSTWIGPLDAALDSEGNIHIAYQKYQPTGAYGDYATIHHKIFNGSSWSNGAEGNALVDNEQYEFRGSVALDVSTDDKVGIAAWYYDNTNGEEHITRYILDNDGNLLDFGHDELPIGNKLDAAFNKNNPDKFGIAYIDDSGDLRWWGHNLANNNDYQSTIDNCNTGLENNNIFVVSDSDGYFHVAYQYENLWSRDAILYIKVSTGGNVVTDSYIVDSSSYNSCDLKSLTINSQDEMIAAFFDTVDDEYYYSTLDPNYGTWDQPYNYINDEPYGYSSLFNNLDMQYSTQNNIFFVVTEDSGSDYDIKLSMKDISPPPTPTLDMSSYVLNNSKYYTGNSHPVITFNYQDDYFSGLDVFDVYLDGSLDHNNWNIANGGDGSSTISLDTEITYEKAYKIEVELFDEAGNSSTTPYEYIYVDFTGPSIPSTPPFAPDNLANGQILNLNNYTLLVGTVNTENVNLTWDTVTDADLQNGAPGSGVDSLVLNYFEYTGSWVYGGTDSVPYPTDTSFEYTNLDEGFYLFLMTATDNVGNTSTEGVAFVKDLTPPTFEANVSGIVADGVYSSEVTLNLIGTVTDVNPNAYNTYSGVDTVSLELFDADGISIWSNPTAFEDPAVIWNVVTVATSAAISETLPELDIGHYSMEITMTDWAGNQATYVLPFQVFPPTIINDPADQSIVDESEVELNFEIGTQDGSELDNIEINVNGSKYGDLDPATISDFTSIDYELELDDGTNEIEVKALDAQSNYSSDTSTVLLDTVDPEIAPVVEVVNQNISGTDYLVPSVSGSGTDPNTNGADEVAGIERIVLGVWEGEYDLNNVPQTQPDYEVTYYSDSLHILGDPSSYSTSESFSGSIPDLKIDYEADPVLYTFVFVISDFAGNAVTSIQYVTLDPAVGPTDATHWTFDPAVPVIPQGQSVDVNYTIKDNNNNVVESGTVSITGNTLGENTESIPNLSETDYEDLTYWVVPDVTAIDLADDSSAIAPTSPVSITATITDSFSNTYSLADLSAYEGYLVFTWTADSGSIAGDFSGTTYTTPSDDGNYTITVTYGEITDSTDRYVSSSGPEFSIAIDGETYDLSEIPEVIDQNAEIVITATDANGVVEDTVSITLDTSAIDRSSLSILAVGSESTSLDVNLSSVAPFSAGEHTLDISATDAAGTSNSETITFRTYDMLAVTGTPMNYPNPCSYTTGTTIRYNLTQDADIVLMIYSMTGQFIWRRAYAAGITGGSAGQNEITWDLQNDFGTRVGNGVYIYMITSGGKVLGSGEIAVYH